MIRFTYMNQSINDSLSLVHLLLTLARISFAPESTGWVLDL